MRFTTTAQDHVAREQQWWLENRDYRDLFATELEEAVALVARLPGAGTQYTGAGVEDSAVSTYRRSAVISTTPTMTTT